MWVCRTGYNDEYVNTIFECKMLFLPWIEYAYDLNNYNNMEDYRELVIKEKRVDNRTTISNWAGQLFSFAKRMKVGDYVMVPQNSSRIYNLVKIQGDYCFLEEGILGLHHSRSIEVICKDIPREIFSQNVQYSLGAFRTLFQVKQEKEILETLQSWNNDLIF